jgi:hypothetical protein
MNLLIFIVFGLTLVKISNKQTLKSFVQQSRRVVIPVDLVIPVDRLAGVFLCSCWILFRLG